MSGNMSNGDRAKQFAPFSALRGLESTLWENTRRGDERRLLGEDAQAELNRKLLSLHAGETVWVEYYDRQRYIQATGVFRRIDEDARRLLLRGKAIPLTDIREIWQEEL